MRQRHYLTPMKAAYLLAGEGPENHYNPRTAGKFFQHEENTPALPLSVAVSSTTVPNIHEEMKFKAIMQSGSPAIVPDLHEEMSFEAIIQSGILDRPLPRPIEEKITRRGKALLFLRRLGNYLRIRGGVARIHHSKLARFAEVEPADRKALSRYKSVGIKVSLFYESDNYVVGERSIEYTLTDEARNLIRLQEEASRGRVRDITPKDMPRPFSPEHPCTQDHRREAL